MKKLVSILLVLVMALSFTGCGKKDKTPTTAQTVHIWHTYTEGQKETLEKIVAAFNKEYEGKITVVCEDQEYKGFTNKVYEAVAAGTGPDIIMNYASTAASYVGASDEETMVVNLKDYLEQDYSKLVNAGVYEECNAFTDGQMHVLPMVTTGPVFFYNKTLFEQAGITEAPTTWEEVGEDAKIIHEKLGIVGFAADSLTDLYQSIIMQSGLSYIDTDTKTVKFLTDELATWLKWFQAGVEEGYFELGPQSGDYLSNDINAGLCASYVGSSAGIPYLTLPNNNELACVSLPQVKDAKTQWAPAWDRGVIVFKSNADQEWAAVKFAEYFVNEENNTAWCKSMNAFSPYLATQKNTEYTDFVSSDIALTALSKQISYSGVLPTPAGASTVRDELEALVKKVATGTDVKTAMADCQKSCDAALQEAE